VSHVTYRADSNLDAIDPAQWDSLLRPGDHQASHRFLRVCRDAGIEDARYRYVRVLDGPRLAATAALASMTVSLDLLAPGAVRFIAQAGRTLYPRFLRVRILFCGLPVSFGSSSLRFAPDADAARVFPLVERAMDEFAESEEVGLLCVKELTEAERENADALLGLGFFRAASLPGMALRIEWADFEGYARAMRSGYRRQLRASLAARASRNLRLRVVSDWREECERIYPLYAQVMDRAEFQMERLPRAFFERLAWEFSGEARALLLERDGDLEAAAIVLDGPETMTFLLTGIDYARNETDRAYENLVAEVVAEAIRSGARRLELGQTSYALKSRLGGVTEPRWLYLKHRRAIPHAAIRRGSGLLFPEASVPRRHVFSRGRGEAAASR
jgi:predicted N-acyltransferase